MKEPTPGLYQIDRTYHMMDILGIDKVSVPNNQMPWPAEVVKHLRISEYNGKFFLYRDGTISYEGPGQKTALRDGKPVEILGMVRLTGREPHQFMIYRVNICLTAKCIGEINSSLFRTSIPNIKKILKVLFKI